jgi:hypothetical protein
MDQMDQDNNGREELRLAAERVLSTHSLPHYTDRDHDEAIEDLAAALTIVRAYLASH